MTGHSAKAVSLNVFREHVEGLRSKVSTNPGEWLEICHQNHIFCVECDVKL